MNGICGSFLSMLVCFSILSSVIPLAVMAQQSNSLSLETLAEGKTSMAFVLRRYTSTMPTNLSARAFATSAPASLSTFLSFSQFRRR